MERNREMSDNPSTDAATSGSEATQHLKGVLNCTKLVLGQVEVLSRQLGYYRRRVHAMEEELAAARKEIAELREVIRHGESQLAQELTVSLKLREEIESLNKMLASVALQCDDAWRVAEQRERNVEHEKRLEAELSMVRSKWEEANKSQEEYREWEERVREWFDECKGLMTQLGAHIKAGW